MTTFLSGIILFLEMSLIAHSSPPVSLDRYFHVFDQKTQEKLTECQCVPPGGLLTGLRRWLGKLLGNPILSCQKKILIHSLEEKLSQPDLFREMSLGDYEDYGNLLNELKRASSSRWEKDQNRKIEQLKEDYGIVDHLSQTKFAARSVLNLISRLETDPPRENLSPSLLDVRSFALFKKIWNLEDLPKELPDFLRSTEDVAQVMKEERNQGLTFPFSRDTGTYLNLYNRIASREIFRAEEGSSRKARANLESVLEVLNHREVPKLQAQHVTFLDREGHFLSWINLDPKKFQKNCSEEISQLADQAQKRKVAYGEIASLVSAPFRTGDLLLSSRKAFKKTFRVTQLGLVDKLKEYFAGSDFQHAMQYVSSDAPMQYHSDPLRSRNQDDAEILNYIDGLSDFYSYRGHYRWNWDKMVVHPDLDTRLKRDGLKLEEVAREYDEEYLRSIKEEQGSRKIPWGVVRNWLRSKNLIRQWNKTRDKTPVLDRVKNERGVFSVEEGTSEAGKNGSSLGRVENVKKTLNKWLATPAYESCSEFAFKAFVSHLGFIEKKLKERYTLGDTPIFDYSKVTGVDMKALYPKTLDQYLKHLLEQGVVSSVEPQNHLFEY